MGIVFTWDQVKNRMIPSVRDIIGVTAEVKSLLSAEPDVLAGVVYGSYIHNALNVRSDVDVMIVYRKGSLQVSNRVSEALHIAGQMHVSLEITTVDEEIAATRGHDYGPLMLAHLSCAAGKQGCIKRDPTQLLLPNATSAEEDVRAYLRHKRAYFENRRNYLYHLSDSEMSHLLRKITEIATHVGRRVVALSDEPKAADSKKAVLERYPMIANQRSVELFYELIAADDAYTKELTTQLNGGPGPTEERRYRKALKSIRACLPLALEFVRQNSIALNDK